MELELDDIYGVFFVQYLTNGMYISYAMKLLPQWVYTLDMLRHTPPWVSTLIGYGTIYISVGECTGRMLWQTPKWVDTLVGSPISPQGPRYSLRARNLDRSSHIRFKQFLYNRMGTFLYADTCYIIYVNIDHG